MPNARNIRKANCSQARRQAQSGYNKGTIRNDIRYLRGIKRFPPTPFDINQLHHNAALSRQRSRVRVSSSPPYFQSLTENPEKNLGPFGSNKPRSSPRAARSPERIQERTLQYQLLNH